MELPLSMFGAFLFDDATATASKSNNRSGGGSLASDGDKGREMKERIFEAIIILISMIFGAWLLSGIVAIFFKG
jgi:hypothetical protein